MEKIRIYDTTLRDGMQAQGVSFSLQDKLLIAEHLDKISLDYIEGGYAASNQKEMQFFEQIRDRKLSCAKIAGFGNTRRADCSCEEDASLQAILKSKAQVATLVGKSWDMQVIEVLKCSLEENLSICCESVEYMKSKGLEVIFDAEHFYDGFKANPEYSMQVLEAAVNGGADTLALCETNGGALPHDVYNITKEVCERFPNVIIGIHTHNDSDCAVANTLAAVRAGARHVQGTINGIGERTGNANLCSIIPNLTFKMGFETIGLDNMKKLTQTSRFVFEMANMSPVTSLPYVGESAFAHKAGLHVNAILKNKKTYEHLEPEIVGNERRFLISELSGASNILAKLEKTKIGKDRKRAREILNTVQNLESQGYQFEAADGSFDLIVKKVTGEYSQAFELEKYHVNVERSGQGNTMTEATVKLSVDGRSEHVVGEGDGPVNALDAALRKALEVFYPNLKNMHLIDYKVRVVNAKAGTAAKVCVIIESKDQDTSWGTVGVSENIIDASWKALKDSIEYKILKDAQSVV